MTSKEKYEKAKKMAKKIEDLLKNGYLVFDSDGEVMDNKTRLVCNDEDLEIGFKRGGCTMVFFTEYDGKLSTFKKFKYCENKPKKIF